MGMISVNPRFKYGLLAYICGVKQCLYTFLSLYFVFNYKLLSNASIGDLQLVQAQVGRHVPCLDNNGRVEHNVEGSVSRNNMTSNLCRLSNVALQLPCPCFFQAPFRR